jgi:hypothetical protein
LDGIGEFDVEIIDVRTNTYNNTPYIVVGVVGVVAANVKNVFPQGPIWMGPEKALAEGYEDGDVEDGVGSKLM